MFLFMSCRGVDHGRGGKLSECLTKRTYAVVPVCTLSRRSQHHPHILLLLRSCKHTLPALHCLCIFLHFRLVIPAIPVPRSLARSSAAAKILYRENETVFEPARPTEQVGRCVCVFAWCAAAGFLFMFFLCALKVPYPRSSHTLTN